MRHRTAVNARDWSWAPSAAEDRKGQSTPRREVGSRDGRTHARANRNAVRLRVSEGKRVVEDDTHTVRRRDERPPDLDLGARERLAQRHGASLRERRPQHALFHVEARQSASRCTNASERDALAADEHELCATVPIEVTASDGQHLAFRVRSLVNLCELERERRKERPHLRVDGSDGNTRVPSAVAAAYAHGPKRCG